MAANIIESHDASGSSVGKGVGFERIRRIT